MVMFQHQNAGRSHNINIENSSFERVEQFNYFGTTLTHQNSIQEKIKSRLKSWNACHHLVENVLSSCLLSKNIKIKIYITIIVPAIFSGCETWSLTLREVCKLRVFENRVLRRKFGPKRNEVTGKWRKLHNEELNGLYSSGEQIEKKDMSGACSTYGGEKVHTGFWWGNLKERDHLEDPGMDGKIILRWIFRK